MGSASVDSCAAGGAGSSVGSAPVGSVVAGVAGSSVGAASGASAWVGPSACSSVSYFAAPVCAGPRPHRLLHPAAQLRLVHDAGVDPLEPMVPPAEALLKEADRRPGLREMRIFMCPWPHQALARRFESGEQTEDCVGVAIRPNATEDGVTFEQRAGETLGHQHPGRAETRHAGADNSNGVDVCEIHQVS